MLKEAKYGGIVGDDFAGVVQELGPDVPEGTWTVGERVAGLVFGSQCFKPFFGLLPPRATPRLQY